MFAKITLLNPNSIIQTYWYIQEFDKQIKELLGKRLIRNHRSLHTSPTFIARIVLNKKQKKLEW